MFLFTHIEKCAGTSFNEILSLTFPRYIQITKNNYGGNEHRNDLSLAQFKKIKKYFPSGIGGHCIRPYLEFMSIRSKKYFGVNYLEASRRGTNNLLNSEKLAKFFFYRFYFDKSRKK